MKAKAAQPEAYLSRNQVEARRGSSVQRKGPAGILAPPDRSIGRALTALALGLAIGSLGVTILRQTWAKPQVWWWGPLLAAMVLCARSLWRLRDWLPGVLLPARLAGSPAAGQVSRGILLIGASLVLTLLLCVRLWPEPREWRGTPAIWVTCVGLLVAGAWQVASVGDGSPRAATARSIWKDGPRNRRLEMLGFALILALAIFLRTYRLDTIPAGIYVDETNAALDALYILEGRDVSPFGSGWYGTPNGYLYYMAGAFRAFGANWWTLKAISLLPAILTIPAVYLLGRLLFGPIGGLSAMFLVAISRWHLSMSRWGWNETAPPMFQALATFFLVRGLRDRRALDYALGGLLTGLSLYTYLSARLAAATLLTYVLLWLVSDPAGLRESFRRSWTGLTMFALAAIVTAAPLGVTYAKDPFAFANRASEISIFRDVRQEGSLQPLILNLGDMLKFFHQTGDHQGKHNLPDEPMTDPFTGLLFAIGLAYAIVRWRDHRHMLLLLWLLIGLAGGYLSSHHESPQSYRSLTALPAVALMAADVLDQLFRLVVRLGGVWRVTKWRRSIIGVLASSTVMLPLAAAGAWESSVYFGPQARSLAVLRGFNPMENRVAKDTVAALDEGLAVYLSPRFSAFSPLRFLVYGRGHRLQGANALDDPPYEVVLPETTLPLSSDGRDALLLLDREYAQLESYFQSVYPGVQFEVERLPDGDALYTRVLVESEEVAALQGLKQKLTFGDGGFTQSVVPGVALDAPPPSLVGAEWEGSLRIPHGGWYELAVPSGLDVYLDGRLWRDAAYLGRGLYGLRTLWRGPDAEEVRLRWKVDDGDPVEIPAGALFTLPGHQNGLLSRYWRNMIWEGEPEFRQVTPFLLLAWPDEEPIMPRGPFSASYTGLIRIPYDGEYAFRVEADDGARLFIDGSLAAEGLVAGRPNAMESTLALGAGEHRIQVDYFQQGGGSGLRLLWRLDGPEWIPVSPEHLIPTEP